MKDPFSIPTIMTSQEVLDKAFSRAGKVEVADGDPFHRRRKTGMARVTSAGDVIGSTLEKYTKAFPSFDNLHPYLREMCALAVDVDAVKRSLGAIQWAGRTIADVCRKAADQIKRTRTPEFVEKKRAEAYGRISSIMGQVAPDLERLGRARDVLRKMPSVDPEIPTVVVAGVPNVGKSALVARLSTARPRVAQYPFTTRDIHVGYFEDRRMRFQVIDTPGLLERPPEERNDIEKRAAAALRHLGAVVVFLLDPSDSCGFDMETQLRLLDRIRKEFPELPVVATETKLDLCDSGSDRMKLSATTGDGVEGLRDELVDMLGQRYGSVDGQLMKLMEDREEGEGW